MTARVVARTTIDATRQEVFARLIDLKSHHLWNPHLQSIYPKTVLALGQSYTTHSLLLGISVEAHIIVSNFKKSKLLELTNTTGTLKYRVVYTLQSENGRTLLRCTTTVFSENKAFAFTKPILKLLAQRELQSDLHALKKVVEREKAR